MRKNLNNAEHELPAIIDSNAEKLIAWIEDNPPDSLDCESAMHALVSLLWLIHAPHNLMQFLSVTSQLVPLLECLNELLDDKQHRLFEDLDIAMDDVLVVAQHLEENEDYLYELIGEEILSVPSTTRHPLFQYLGRYYIYAAIMTTPESDSQQDEELLNQLKATALYCHAYLIHATFTPVDYISSHNLDDYQSTEHGKDVTINACRFIRQATHELSRDMLAEINDFTSIQELFDSLKEHYETGIESKAYTQFRPLIKRALQGKSNDDRAKGGSRGGRSSWTLVAWNNGFVRGRNGVFMEQSSPQGESFILAMPDQPTEDIKEILEAGLVPEENAVDEEIILLDDNNPKSVRILAKNQVKHLEMANQHFKFDWHHNTISELTDLLKLCGTIIRDPKSISLQKESVCLMLISLVTGTSIEDIIPKFRYRLDYGRFNKRTINFVWNEETSSGIWMIYPMLPIQEKQLTQLQKSYCEIHNARMELPDVFNIGSFIHATFRKESLKTCLNKKLFQHRYETYRPVLFDILQRLNKGNRINESRIQSHLFNTIVAQVSGDITEATLLSGRYHPLAKTRLHYSAYPTHYLQEIYISAFQKMVSDVYAEGYSGKEAIPAEYKQNTDNVIGSEYCPRTDAVQHSVSTLLSLISEKPKTKDYPSIANYHNLYTLYTVLMTGYCTGYRAVRDPFPATPDIDKETGFCVISDKDGPDFYNCRLVWIPDVLADQLRHYAEHREVMLLHLMDNNKNLPLLNGLPDLFFVDDDLNIVHVRPATISEKLEQILPLPVNSNRRYLRTHLRLNGCPAEIVDAFMGHWSRGEEPWGQYSTLSYREISDHLKKYMTPLISSLGFKAKRSLYYGF